MSYTIEGSCLNFKQGFNEPIDDLFISDNIYRIFFNSEFNQPIKKFNGAKNVYHIHFGANFNQSINDTEFPEKLKELKFHHDYNQPILKIPKNLKEFSLELPKIKNYIDLSILEDVNFEHEYSWLIAPHSNIPHIKEFSRNSFNFNKIICKNFYQIKKDYNEKFEKQEQQIIELKKENQEVILQLKQTNQLLVDQVNDLKKEIEILMDTIKQYHLKN